MEMIKLVLFLVFAIATIVGYKKNNRGLMLLGAVAVTIGFIGLDFIYGFVAELEGA